MPKFKKDDIVYSKRRGVGNVTGSVETEESEDFLKYHPYWVHFPDNTEENTYIEEDELILIFRPREI